MNIDDRGRRAATDLARKAVQANLPSPPSERPLLTRRVWAFSLGAVVIIVLVLVPLVLLGGPRDPDEPADTVTSIPSTTTEAPRPTTTEAQATTEPETTTTVPTAETTVIDDLAALLPEAPSPDIVAQLEWGAGDDQLGLTEGLVGPAGFDVASDGTIVIVDHAKLRLIAVGPHDGAVRTIAQWDAGDFVPDAMVIASRDRNDVIFVLGMTNRPGRPHDLISMGLDGTVIDRVETVLSDPMDLVVNVGNVWATELIGADAQWIPLSGEAGDVFDPADQVPVKSLYLGDSRLTVQYPGSDTGVTVTLTNLDGVAAGVVRIDPGGETWGHTVLPLGDRFLVTAFTSDFGPDGAVGRIAAVIDLDGNVVDGFSWAGSRWAEIGPFGILRFGPDGAVYDMYSTEAGVEIRRYPLSAASAFDDLAARSGYGRAMAVDGDSLWIAGPQRVSSERGDWSEILRVDTRTHQLIGSYDLELDMHSIDAMGGTVWMTRAGDGAYPENLVGRLDAATGDLELADLGDLSARDIAATDSGMWLVSWNGRNNPELAFVDGATMRVGSRIPMPVEAQPKAIDIFDGVLWIGSYDGMVYRFDTGIWQFLDPYDTSLAVVDIMVEEDRFGSDLAAWVMGDGGGVRKLTADGAVAVTVSLPGFGGALAGGGTMGTVWAVTDTGDVYFVGEDGELSLVAETGVPGVNDMVFDGGHLWILGETLATVSMGG